MTLAELAERVGMTPQVVQRYEVEPQRLRVSQLDVFAKALACDRCELVAEVMPDEFERNVVAITRQMPLADRRRLAALLKVLWPEIADIYTD